MGEFSLMQCERAQEFFSDYLERTLDRPMTAALEAHLGTCARCRNEVESLQEMFQVLDRVPPVEPPHDGPSRVMAAIRNQRAEQWEAQRRKAPGFWESLWRSLHGLSPASVGMATGLATLVVAGAVTAPMAARYVGMGFARLTPAPVRQPVAAPVVQASYHPESGQVDLLVTPQTDLPAARVSLEMGGRTWVVSDGFGLGPQRPLKQPVIIPNTGREAEAVWMTVESPSRNATYRYLVVVPLRQRTDERVTLLVESRPVEEALRQLAPYLGRPVVVSGAADATVSLNAAGETAQRCLDSVAQQVHATVTSAADAYHLAPQQ
jgi:hypothetical protein